MPTSSVPVAAIAGLVTILASMAGAEEMSHPPLDLAGIHAVVITGESASIHLAAVDDGPFAARSSSRRTGWGRFWTSSWFSRDCRASVAMRIDEGVLRIQVAPSDWLDFGECMPDVKVDLPAKTDVSINQKAFAVTMTGEFGSIDLKGDAADASLDGYASRIAWRGEAGRIRLAFDRALEAQSIDLSSKALDATISTREAEPLRYVVEADAAFVDAPRPSAPDARASLSVKAAMARVTIR